MKANVYRSSFIPVGDTGGLTVQAAAWTCSPCSPPPSPRATTSTRRPPKPVAVLGAAAAQRLGIDRVYPGERIWVGGLWFYVAGILNPAALAPEIDTSVLVGYPAAENYLGSTAIPSTIYVRAHTVGSTQSTTCSLRPPTRRPQRGRFSQPSSALIARADAKAR